MMDSVEILTSCDSDRIIGEGGEAGGDTCHIFFLRQDHRLHFAHTTQDLSLSSHLSIFNAPVSSQRNGLLCAMSERAVVYTAVSPL